MKRNQDISLLVSIFENAGYCIKKIEDDRNDQTIELYFRNNPDGTIRWLWPVRSKKAGYLELYSTATLKSRLFSLYTKCGFAIHGKLLAHGKLVLYTDALTAESISANWGQNFAIFTGTPGPNRKAILFYEHQGNRIFTKIALTGKSTMLITREAARLDLLSSLQFTSIQIPAIRNRTNKSLTIDDVKSVGAGRSAVLLPVHICALKEVYQKTSGKGTIASLSQWTDMKQQLEYLMSAGDPRLPKGMIRKLKMLSDSINPEEQIGYSLAHNDFTPWNMFVTPDSIQVYDWELSVEKAPLLTDAYHFIFQESILQKRSSAAQILKAVRDLQSQPWASELFVEQEFDQELTLALYLLFTCTYYLHLYSMQPEWHVQVGWLLKTWNETISVVLSDRKILSARQLLVIDLFDELNNYTYATLKWRGGFPEDLSVHSDIDLCVKEAAVENIHDFICGHPLATSFHVMRKSFMRNYAIITESVEVLSIDLIWQFKRKKMEMMAASEVLAGSVATVTGVRVPSRDMDIKFVVLFYSLNHMPVPEAYRKRFELHEDRDEREIAKEVRALPANKGLRGLKNILLYYLDSARNFFPGKGMIITFSGVDGAGKSTVIARTKLELEKVMRRNVVVLRHRPSILPIISSFKYGKAEAGRRSAETLPRQGDNSSRISSLLRFAYYFTDYFFGQFYILFRYYLRGYIVLYDRFYFDFINDSRRSNISLSGPFTRWFYRFLLKPDINFFLYADTQEILKRKQELSAMTIEQLTHDYQMLFYSLSKEYPGSKYIPVYNQHLEKTMSVIVEQVQKSSI